MIHLYSSMGKVPSGLKFIQSNDLFFDYYAARHKYVFCQDGEVLEAIKLIDGAEILDFNTGCIKTPFGMTDLQHLSTGCKTAINILSGIADGYLVNLNECGENVLGLLFSKSDSLDFYGLLEHCDFPFDLKICGTLDDHPVQLSDDIMEHFWEELYAVRR